MCSYNAFSSHHGVHTRVSFFGILKVDILCIFAFILLHGQRFDLILGKLRVVFCNGSFDLVESLLLSVLDLVLFVDFLANLD